MFIGRFRVALRMTLAVGTAVMLSSCAASRALNAPAKKDYGVLKPGTVGDLVRAELGEPLKSVGRDDCDVFAFHEGTSGWRYLRAIGYSLLDVGTLGASEILTNPIEASVGKGKVRLRVCYDAKQNVIYSERLEVGKPPQLTTGAYPPTRLPMAGTPTGTLVTDNETPERGSVPGL